MHDDHYWKSYLELESQILKLSRSIEFDDANFDHNVHSVAIANLILQCAANIESIAKDLYITNNTNNTQIDRDKIHYDYDCIMWLINNWGLKMREIVCKPVSEKSKEHNRNYRPFDNRRKYKQWHKQTYPSWRWNEAYQSIKHDYINAIASDATLHNLVETLAAFYILVLYYEDIEILPDTNITGYSFDMANTYLDTDLFSPSIFPTYKQEDVNKFKKYRKKCLFVIEEGNFIKNGWHVPQRLILNKES